MPKYVPTDQDYDDRLTGDVPDMNADIESDMSAEEIALRIQAVNEQWVSLPEKCTACQQQGQAGTADRLPFIHKKGPMTDLIGKTRESILNIDQYSSYIYGGYGSPFDMQITMLTPEVDKSVADSLCSDCLIKALLAIGKPIDAYDYGFQGAHLVYSPMSVEDLIAMQNRRNNYEAWIAEQLV